MEHGHGHDTKPKVEPPVTREGHFALHQTFAIDWLLVKDLEDDTRHALLDEAISFFTAQTQRDGASGQSALFSLVGGKGDLMTIHFRPTLDAINEVEMAQARLDLNHILEPVYSYVSVAEASGYDSARKRQQAMLRKQGVSEDSDSWREAMVVLEKQEEIFLKKRLQPEFPDVRYACFYPMSKRRGETFNWYKLTRQERGMLMRGHATVGRKYTDRVTQIITGSIGFDDYEWGVTLLADDPVLFKKLVYDMRFDPVSADYAEFGPFMSGVRIQPTDLANLLDGQLPKREG